MKVCIIGMGYVGLPLAKLCSRKNHKTFGLDVDKKKVELLKKDYDNISFATDYGVIKDCDVVIICVPTPVDEKFYPDLSCVKNVSEGIAKNLKKGQLIILESTVNPGVTEEFVKPILEKSGLKAGKDFFLAHCPERINPGDKKWNVNNIPRVLGATSKKGCEIAEKFYESILEAPIQVMSCLKAAEAVKIVENAFRDVNIAFVNELAQSFDKFGIDVKEVIEGASTKPFGFLPHYPSSGVGGHCIGVDPYYLIEKAKSLGYDHEFLKLARKINNSMPNYTVKLLVDCLNKIGKSVQGTKIGILGLAYKGGVGDTRESPSYKVINELKNIGAELLIFDPYVLEESNSNLNKVLSEADAVIVLTDHPEFKNLDFSKVKIVIDGKNFLNKEKIKKHSIYKGVGR